MRKTSIHNTDLKIQKNTHIPAMLQYINMELFNVHIREGAPKHQALKAFLGSTL